MARKKGPLKPERPEATEDVIKKGFSRVGKTADGAKQCFLDFKLEGTTMSTAELLAIHTNLQRLELRNNELTDLSAISSMKYLTSLDASHNKLTEVVTLEPVTLNMRSLNLSHNCITAMKDISMYRQLSELVLDGNKLTQLEGLQSLTHLKVLSAQRNVLTTCKGLEKCFGLRELNLSHNKIISLASLKPLEKLEKLEVKDNLITTLDGLQGVKKLIQLDCSDNKIQEIEEIRYARPLPFLKQLIITGNDILSYHASRLHVIFMIPQLEVLNGTEVTADENVNAGNIHGGDAEGLKAIRQKYFPKGELDDGGGAVVPVSAGLLASNGLDAKDDEVHFAAADTAAKNIDQELILKGLDKLGDHFLRKLPSQLALARACWTWVIHNAADIPEHPWSVGVPALKPECSAVEQMLIPNKDDGTYAEKLALIFALLCRACQLEANEVLGFWKHDGVVPGTKMTSHNHCWNSVKVNGRWRLLDVYWAVEATKKGYDVPFYVSAEAFIYSRFPLEEWWQLLTTYISADQFWEMPFCSLFFFTKGFYYTNDALNAVNEVKSTVDPDKPVEFAIMPMADINLEHPSEVIMHELLDENCEPVLPDRQPASYVFTQVCTYEAGGKILSNFQELKAKGLVSQDLYVSLPRTGSFYVRVRLVNGPNIMMLKYIVPEGTVGKPLTFPVVTPEFLTRGCQIVSPPMSTVLRGDMVYDWEVFAPKASSVIVGNQDGSDCKMLVEHSVPGLFALTVDTPRVQETSVFAWFADAPGKHTCLMSYSVFPAVHDLVRAEDTETELVAAAEQRKARANELFKAMDLNKDGFVSRSELALGLRSNPNLGGLLGIVDEVAIGINTEEFHKLFMIIDTTGLGRISWPDFLRRIQEVADSMPRVTAEVKVMDDEQVVVKLLEHVPHLSVSCNVALDGSVRVSFSQDAQ